MSVQDTNQNDGNGSISGTMTVDEVLERPENKRSGFEGFEEYEEVRRYWVIRPYAYISILYSEEEKNYVYYIVEPDLDKSEYFLKEDINDMLKDRLMTRDVDEGSTTYKSVFEQREDILIKEALSLAKEHGLGIDDNTLHKILYYIERDFIRYGNIEPIMQDPNIEDISCNGYEVPLYVFHREEQDLKTNIEFERRELNDFIIRLAQRSGKHISAANPLIDASLPDGSRAHLSLGSDVSTRGSAFTIRKFRDEPLTPIQLIKYGTFSLEQMSYLWIAIENDMSLIFAGGTGSGKTTSMNSVSLFIPPKKKIVSIEDTRELSLPHENWVPFQTRGAFGATQHGGDEQDRDTSGEVNMFNLLVNALRARPEYLLVGEVRGPEAKTLFQAINTGHTTYSTFHADSVDSLLQRFRSEPIQIPNQLLSALDIVSVQEQIRVGDERVRRNRTIAEIKGVNPDGDGVTWDSYFDYLPSTDSYEEEPGYSEVLSKIRDKREWDMDRVRKERKQRERVLEYMVENNIEEYEAVTRILQTFMIDKNSVLERIENNELTKDDFKDLQYIGE